MAARIPGGARGVKTQFVQIRFFSFHTEERPRSICLSGSELARVGEGYRGGQIAGLASSGVTVGVRGPIIYFMDNGGEEEPEVSKPSDSKEGDLLVPDRIVCITEPSPCAQ